jgi:hypothetical protein
MPVFLSDEWIAAFDQLLGSRPVGEDNDGDRAGPLVIGHTITGCPGGSTVEYHVVVFAAEHAVRRGRPAAATVAFSCDYDTAVAVSRGDEPAQTVFLDGRLLAAGDTAALLDARAALEGIGEAADALRADTTYPKVPSRVERHA